MKYQLSRDIFLEAKVVGGGGDVPPTVLVHGWGVTSKIWNSVTSRWRHGALVVPDLRGVGGSCRPETGHHYTDHGTDIIALIEELDGGPVRLVGHSMGGLIAQWVAVERPDLLCSLTLVSPTPAGGVPLTDDEVVFFESLYDNPHQLITMMLRSEPDPMRVSDVIADVERVSRQAFVEGFRSWRSADFADRLASIRTPTVVMSGALEEPLTPDLVRATVVQAIPDARYIMLEDVGHYPQIEAPDTFFDTLTATLVSSS